MYKMVYKVLPDKDYIKIKGVCKEDDFNIILRIKSEKDIYEIGELMKKVNKAFSNYNDFKKFEIILNN